MFTGIIEELGAVSKIQRRAGVVNLTIACKVAHADTKVGDSVSVNGVCLTVVYINKDSLTFDLIGETIKKANLGNLKLRDKVNLERATKLGERLGGHLVTGHIDCVGIIRQKRQVSGDIIFNISIPEEFSKYLVDKGSVTIDGISLTIAQVRGNTFSVHLIPHTLKMTTLGFKGPSDKVNIESDLIGKYISSFGIKKDRKTFFQV